MWRLPLQDLFFSLSWYSLSLTYIPKISLLHKTMINSILLVYYLYDHHRTTNGPLSRHMKASAGLYYAGFIRVCIPMHTRIIPTQAYTHQ